MTATQSIQLYQILQEHFGKSEHAAKAVSAIEAMIEEKVQAGSTRQEEILHKDIGILRTDMSSELQLVRTNMSNELKLVRSDMSSELRLVRTAMNNELTLVRSEFHKDIQLLRAEIDKKLELLRGSLETKIAEASVSNLRWVFSFFIALSLMIIGLYLKK